MSGWVPHPPPPHSTPSSHKHASKPGNPQLLGQRGLQALLPSATLNTVGGLPALQTPGVPPTPVQVDTSDVKVAADIAASFQVQCVCRGAAAPPPPYTHEAAWCKAPCAGAAWVNRGLCVCADAPSSVPRACTWTRSYG